MKKKELQDSRIAEDAFLPTTKKEMKKLGWEEADVILFSGDAYVDHPSFGPAVIGRVLENEGYRVAIVPQPNWRDDLRDFKKLGKPRLFFGVTAGVMDSMVNHYTANKRLRSDDAYTPDGRAGYRPDYPTVVYTSILKKLFPDTPVVLGGVEASLRRFTHFDYWQNKLMPSIIHQSKADLLVYGMGETPIIEIARFLDKGIPVGNLHNVNQTVAIVDKLPKKVEENYLHLYSHEECLNDKIKFAKNFRTIEEESNVMEAKGITQQIGDKFIVANPPAPLLSEKKMDAVFELPFTRLPHPKYNGKGAISAYDMIKDSINIHRGCFGGCAFCTIAAHQGKHIVSRSKKSVIQEIQKRIEQDDFKGVLTDLGGPSANMYKMKGKNLDICKKCRKPSCISPKICKNLAVDHSALVDLYKEVLSLKGIKQAFIGSGVRYDLLFDNDGNITKDGMAYAKQLIENHVSGRLKVAPEHTQNRVLDIMRKPSFDLFKKFNRIFEKVNKESNKNQQLIPYFISSHPGCLQEDMAMLAVETKDLNFRLEQVQDFTPTPMTLATVIYYSGVHPYTLKPVFTARTQKDKLKQRQFFFWYKNEHKSAIIQELNKINRKDIVGKLFVDDRKPMKKTQKNRRRK